MAHELNNHMSWWWEVMCTNKDKLTTTVITLCVLILAILWYRLKPSSSSDGAPSLPPGPCHLAIVGYRPFLSHELHTQFTKMAHTYGPIFKFQIGSKLHVVINTIELAKEVLRDQDETFANHTLTVAASVFSYGGQDIAWSSYNSSWRNLRKIFVHGVLSNKNLEACSSFRRNEVRKTIKNVYNKKGNPIDLKEISFSTEANVVTSMVCENLPNKEGKYGLLGGELKMIAWKIVELLGQPNVSDFFPSLAWFDLQGVEREMKRQLKQLDEIFTRIIDDRIKYNSNKSDDGVGHERKKDFLQFLLELKDQKDETSLDFTKIKALLMDTMVAGTETTSTIIEWIMAEIMQNHHVMKKVQEELTEIVGSNNIVEESHISKLKYLDATIKETFRLHPVIPLAPRSPSQTSTIGGYTIPKDCSMFLNIWAIHRDPRYWDNPLDFTPERFLTHEGRDIYDFKGNNLKFLPFGSGRRLCPGIPLAEKMQIYIVASLLHSFDWNLPNGEEHDLSDKFGFTLQKRKPLIAIPSQRLPNVSLYM